MFVRIGDGDSLQRLANAFRCEPRDFINANADIIAKNGDLIYEGDLLRVPFFAWKGVTPPGFQGRIVTRPIKKCSPISFLQQQFSNSVQATSAGVAKCLKGKEGVLVAILGGILALVGAAAVARKRKAGANGVNVSGSPLPTDSQSLEATRQSVGTVAVASPVALASASSVESNGASLSSSSSSVAAAIEPLGIAVPASAEKKDTIKAPAPSSSSPTIDTAKPGAISSVDDAAAATSLTSRPFSIKATHGTAATAPPTVPVDDLLLPPKEPVATRKRSLPWLAQADASKDELPTATSTESDGQTAVEAGAGVTPPQVRALLIVHASHCVVPCKFHLYPSRSICTLNSTTTWMHSHGKVESRAVLSLFIVLQAGGESKWNQAQETVKASLPALALGLGGISSVALGGELQRRNQQEMLIIAIQLCYVQKTSTEMVNSH